MLKKSPWSPHSPLGNCQDQCKERRLTSVDLCYPTRNNSNVNILFRDQRTAFQHIFRDAQILPVERKETKQ